MKKKLLIISGIIIIILGGFIGYSVHENHKLLSSKSEYNCSVLYWNNNYKEIGKKIDYDIIEKSVLNENLIKNLENGFITSNEELKEYIKKFGNLNIGDKDILDYFNDEYFKKYNLAIDVYDTVYMDEHCVDKITTDKGKTYIYITDTSPEGAGPLTSILDFIFIRLDKEITNVEFNIRVRVEKKYSSLFVKNPSITHKPIIYLYPTQETELLLKLGNKEKITCSYPEYKNGWSVKAQSNGDLIDLETGRNLYALYYESENVKEYKVCEDGFIVEGVNSAKFLEEKLALLGLTDREAEEFIVYWLPKLQKNKYNYIRFATMEEINKNMPLEFSIQPDTLIRVIMTYKGLDEKIEVKEQILEKIERTGFVAVEWGGTEIK